MEPTPSCSTMHIDETSQICSSRTTFVPSVILPGQSRVCLWYWEGGQSRAFLDNPLNSRWIILDHMRRSENWFCQWLTFDRIMAELHSILLPLHFWKLLFGSNQEGGVGGRGSRHRICFWHTAKVAHIPDSFIFWGYISKTSSISHHLFVHRWICRAVTQICGGRYIAFLRKYGIVDVNDKRFNIHENIRRRAFPLFPHIIETETQTLHHVLQSDLRTKYQENTTHQCSP